MYSYIPFAEGGLRSLHCSNRIMYCWKYPLFSVQANPFICFKCVRVTGGLRRIRFFGKDLEVGTQEDIVKAGRLGPGERAFIQHRGQSSPESSGPWTEKLVKPAGGNKSHLRAAQAKPER